MLHHKNRAAAGAKVTNKVGPFAIDAVSNQRLTSGTTLSINKPVGTREGDLMLAVMNIPANSTWTGAADWTEVLDQGTSPSTRIAYKIAGISEGSSYTFTSSASSTSSGTIVTYRSAEYDAVGSVTSNANPLVLSAVTASSDNSLIVATVARAAASITITGPANMQTVAIDNNATSPSRLVEQDDALSSAGSSGTRSFDVGSSTSVSGALVALKPSTNYLPYANYLRLTTANTGATTQTTLTINKPSCVPGNTLVLIIGIVKNAATGTSNFNSASNVTSTWNLERSCSYDIAQPGVAVLTRTVDGSEGSDFTITIPSSGFISAAIVVVGGGEYRTSNETSGTGTSVTVSSPVTMSQNGLLLYAAAIRNANAGVATFTPPSGMTEIADIGINGTASDFSFTVARQEGLSAGSSGTKTATASVSGTYEAVLISIKPF